jgi:hypothetical protein
VALAAAAALGLAYWGWVVKIQPRRAKAAEDAKLLFQGLGADNTSEILLKKKGSDDVLLRKIDGQWRLITPTAAPADSDAVATLVSQLAGAKRNETVVDKGADPRDFGLDQPSGEVTFKPTSPGAKADVLFFGMDSPDGGQTYAMIDGKPEVFLTYLSVKNSALKSAADLRDKTVWTFNPADVLTLTSDKEGFSLSRDKQGQWKVDAGTRHEPGKGSPVDDWLGQLSHLKAASVPSETGQGAFGLRGAKGLRLTLGNGTQLALLEGGKAQPSGCYVQVAGRGPVFQLPPYEVPVIEQKAQGLMDLNVFDFFTGAVTRFEVKRPEGVLKALKTGGAWAWSPARPVKPGEKPFDFGGFLASFANAQLLKRLDSKKDAPLTPTATVTFYGDNGVLLEKAAFGARRDGGQVAASAMKNQTVIAAANLLDLLPPDAPDAPAVAPKAGSVTAHP